MENDMPAADAFESMMNSITFPVSKFLWVMALVAILCGLFLGITFVQSSLNKMFDYKGNKSYFQSVFEKTFLKNAAGILLPVITVLEFLSGLSLVIGIVITICCLYSGILVIGLTLSAFSLICLLTGQRIAKDYAGAASLTTYFLIAMTGLIAAALTF
jgi:putative oxidoreductase